MALTSISDLLAPPNATYTVVEIGHGFVTVEDSELVRFKVPKSTVRGVTKVGDEVVVTLRKASENNRVAQMLAKDFLHEMLKDDELTK